MCVPFKVSSARMSSFHKFIHGILNMYGEMFFVSLRLVAHFEMVENLRDVFFGSRQPARSF